MIGLNKIYNEDCLVTMKNIDNKTINAIITSPPYNMTSRKGGYADTGRYDVYQDWKSEQEYLQWTVDIFNKFYDILVDKGVILYNFSYSIENPSLPYKLVSEIEKQTQFKLADTIIWKKNSGIPFPANPRRLSRIFEFIFVFTKSDFINDFNTNRKVKSVSEKTGQKYYEVVYNYVEAKNNDGKCSYNQATYSSELVEKLLNTYVPQNSECIVYDPFMGTGTTAVACKRYGVSYIGSEISANQCEYANERLKEII